MKVVCSRNCGEPKRDPDQDHPGVCICGGFLDDVSAEPPQSPGAGREDWKAVRHPYEPDSYVGTPCVKCRLEPRHHLHWPPFGPVEPQSKASARLSAPPGKSDAISMVNDSVRSTGRAGIGHVVPTQEADTAHLSAPPAAPQKLNGVFDNRATMQREWYHDSDTPYAMLSALAIETKLEAGGLTGIVKPFGAYVDIPVCAALPGQEEPQK